MYFKIVGVAVFCGISNAESQPSSFYSSWDLNVQTEIFYRGGAVSFTSLEKRRKENTFKKIS